MLFAEVSPALLAVEATMSCQSHAIETLNKHPSLPQLLEDVKSLQANGKRLQRFDLNMSVSHHQLFR
jgi:hypothetical protein